jgi:hypothetical protein
LIFETGKQTVKSGEGSLVVLVARKVRNEGRVGGCGLVFGVHYIKNVRYEVCYRDALIFKVRQLLPKK